ncbi:hypothetical protein ASF98_09315 [Arthrobacter sp. Leaf337]|nr:hypothetical protein ASF98_09315 [Arthrobacter sp. Leaf337]
MRHNVMDIPGQGEPVFVPGGQLPGLALPPPFGHALVAEPGTLPQQHQDHQPGRSGDGADQGAFVPAGHKEGSQRRRAGPGHGPGLPASSGGRREDDGQRQGQQDRTPRVACGKVEDRRRSSRRQHHAGPAPAQGQRRRAGEKQHESQHVKGPVLGLPRSGEDCAHDLDNGHGDHHEGGGRTLESARHTPSLAAAAYPRRPLNGAGRLLPRE